MDIVSLLITVLILALVFGLCVWIIQIIPIPEPFKTIALAVLGLIFILLLLSKIGLIGGVHPLLTPR